VVNGTQITYVTNDLLECNIVFMYFALFVLVLWLFYRDSDALRNLNLCNDISYSLFTLWRSIGTTNDFHLFLECV